MFGCDLCWGPLQIYHLYFRYPERTISMKEGEKKKTMCSIFSLILHMCHANRKKAKQPHTNRYWQKEFWILCPKSDAATIKNDWHKKMYLFIELGQACRPTNRSAVWDRTRYGLVTDTLSTRMTYWTDFLMKSINQPHVVYQIKFLQHQASCFSICMVQWKGLIQTTDQLRYASRGESKLKNRSLMSLANMLKRDRSAQYNNFCNHQYYCTEKLYLSTRTRCDSMFIPGHWDPIKAIVDTPFSFSSPNPMVNNYVSHCSDIVLTHRLKQRF